MKPFSLSTVLKYRKQLEGTAATKLAKAQLELQKKKDELSEAEHQYNSLLSELLKSQVSGITVEELIHYENRLEWLKQQLKVLQEDLLKSLENVRLKRNIVVARSRDKKVLERLKEKQDKEWQLYLDKKEAAQLDEIAVLSHDRKQQEK